MEFNNKILEDIKAIIANSRQRAVRAVDHERVLMYWTVGQKIVEEEQQGKARAGYGDQLIKYLSLELQPEFGSSFSSRNLGFFRQFYRTFPIVNALRSQLSWTHYRKLIALQSDDQREFYIAEAEKNNWSARQLERQVDSNLYERLLLSNDKESVLAVARKEKYPSDAKEIIKDPMVLEFLGLKRESAYYERDLESSLITHLQDFLLELGNGFAFITRQKRIHLDGDDFFVDLVLYFGACSLLFPKKSSSSLLFKAFTSSKVNPLLLKEATYFLTVFRDVSVCVAINIMLRCWWYILRICLILLMLIVVLAMLFEGFIPSNVWLLLQHMPHARGGQFDPEYPGQFTPEWMVSLKQNQVVNFTRTSTG